MSAHRLLVPGLALLLCCGPACGKDKAEGGATKAPVAKDEPTRDEPGGAQPAGGAFHKPILDGLKKAGLQVGEFEATAAKPYQARACARGEISKLDVMTCQHENATVARQAEANLVQFIGGATTGAVRQSGAVSIAVADRSKIDPRGKLVDKLLKTFSSLDLR